MKLESLDLKNFFSYKNQKINFKEDGIYIIYGENKQTGEHNGVGKSVIKEAIKFALFGKSRTNNLDDMVRFGTEKMSVEMNFSVKGNNYKVLRKRNKGSSSDLKLQKENENITASTIKETEKLIEEIIGIDYDKFMHSFCFGQSEYDDLKQMTSTKLIDFLKSVLKLERFNKYYEKVKEKSREIENKINKLEGKKESYKDKTQVEESKEDLENKLKKINEEKIPKNKEEKKELKKDKVELHKQKDNIKTTLQEFKNDRQKSKKRIKFIKNNKKCPLCKSELKNSSLKKELKNKFKGLKPKIKRVKKDLEKKETEITNFEEKIYKINKNMSNLEAKKILINSKISKLLDSSQDINKFKEKLKKLRKIKGILAKNKDIFGSKGLPLYVLETYIPKLEYSINDILSNITDFKLNLKTKKRLKSSDELRNTCKIELFKGNKHYPLENLSNGEELLITLAVRIGISRVYQLESTFETLILDECFGSLGDINKRKVLSLINTLENTFSRIIIISHIESIRDWSKPFKINIIKDMGISYLKY